MLSDSLSEGLEAYGIGPTIRELRIGKDLGLEQLGKHTGLSAGMLSKIERGHVFPTLPTLLRISMVFGVGLDYFFQPAEEKPALAVVRKEDRLRMPNTTEGRPKFHFESLDFPVPDRCIESYLAEFSSAVPTEPHTHAGAEMIYVIQGSLNIHIHGDVHALEEGDSMYFDSQFEHTYSRAGEANSIALVVVSKGSSMRNQRVNT